MARTYADFSALLSQNLQDTGVVEFVAGSVNYQIEEGLKAVSAKVPHIAPIIFQVESRSGTDVTGTASSLTDLVKLQFLAADATNEKVVHNTTDDTWAVVLTRTSTSVLTLSADIMDAGESYRIYNKRCWNERQIYIGDVPEYLGIDSVEYPIGTKRNWTVFNDVLEIHANNIADSDSTLANLGRVDVLVRFKVTHVLSPITLTWELTGDEVKGATDVDIDIASHAAGTIDKGQEFYVENQRTLYIVNADATISTNGRETATIYFYPPLEAAALNNDDVVFVKSTLTPALEEILGELCTGRLLITQAPKYFNLPTPGGVATEQTLVGMGRERRDAALASLKALAPRITKISYSAD